MQRKQRCCRGKIGAQPWRFEACYLPPPATRSLYGWLRYSTCQRAAPQCSLTLPLLGQHTNVRTMFQRPWDPTRPGRCHGSGHALALAAARTRQPNQRLTHCQAAEALTRLDRLHLATDVRLALQQVPPVHLLRSCRVLVGRHNAGGIRLRARGGRGKVEGLSAWLPAVPCARSLSSCTALCHARASGEAREATPAHCAAGCSCAMLADASSRHCCQCPAPPSQAASQPRHALHTCITGNSWCLPLPCSLT